MLDRIGRVVVRRHLAVVVVALVVPAVAGVFGGGVQSKLSHGGFDDPSAESTAATAALVRDFAGGEPNLILIAGSEGAVDSAGVADAGRRLTQAAAGQPGVLAVESYWTVGRPATLRSRNGREALAGDEEQAAVRAGTLVPTLRGLAGPLRIQAAGPAQVQAEVGLAPRPTCRRPSSWPRPSPWSCSCSCPAARSPRRSLSSLPVCRWSRRWPSSARSRPSPRCRST